MLNMISPFSHSLTAAAAAFDKPIQTLPLCINSYSTHSLPVVLTFGMRRRNSYRLLNSTCCMQESVFLCCGQCSMIPVDQSLRQIKIMNLPEKRHCFFIQYCLPSSEALQNYCG